MALWTRRRDNLPPEERVRQTFEEARRLAGTKPRAALRSLDRLKGDAHALVTFGGPYHEPFTEIVMEALGWSGPVPAVSPHPWHEWEGRLTVADVLDLARKTEEPVLYLYQPPGRSDRGPVAEIEGLQALAGDEQLVMVVTGGANALIRRDLLLLVAEAADPGSEEILQEITDAARKKGFRVLAIIG